MKTPDEARSSTITHIVIAISFLIMFIGFCVSTLVFVDKDFDYQPVRESTSTSQVNNTYYVDGKVTDCPKTVTIGGMTRDARTVYVEFDVTERCPNLIQNLRIRENIRIIIAGTFFVDYTQEGISKDLERTWFYLSNTLRGKYTNLRIRTDEDTMVSLRPNSN